MAKVLLAEDSVTMQKVIDVILKGEGYDLKAVNTGEDALSVIADFAPDLLLADVSMPGISGYQLAEEVKNSPETSEIPIILLLGAYDKLDEDLYRKARIDDSLVKPFEAKDLLDKVSALLGGEAAAQADEEAEEVFEITDEEEGAEEAEVAEVLDLEGFDEVALEADVTEGSGEEMLGGIDLAAEEEEDAPVSGDISAAFNESVGGKVAEAFARIDIKQIIGSAVEGKLAEVLGSIDVSEMIVEVLSSGLKESMEKTLLETVPELANDLLREKLEEAMGSVRSEIENVIWETVPELAESIIRKEIENIKAGN